MSITVLPTTNQGNDLGRRGVAGQEFTYWDVDDTFTPRKAVLAIRNDTGATAPTNIQPTIHILTRSRGDNATFIGAAGLYVQTRDRTDVDGTNKGVLYGVQIDLVPQVARNNVPNDDATGLLVTNASGSPGFKGTDAIYVGHNTAFGTNHEFVTGVQVDANTDYAFFSAARQFGTGLELRGTYANYGIDMQSGTWTGAAGIRFPNNINAIVGRNGAGSADVTMLKINSNNDAAMGFNGVVRTNCVTAQLGFFNTTPVVKQTVTGAKGSNAALGSLIAALVAHGMITDTTSA